ncbi:MAG: type VI secretion system-associated FHA domain protein TagH [Vicinamibacterales bacterium]
MILTLEITGPQAEALGEARHKVFNAVGGSIGRKPDNYWALPDPYISGHHALIHYENGVFSIEDTSTNGIYVNSQDNRLVRGQPYALKSGDWIFIEPFEIRASITIEANEAALPPTDDVFAPVPGSARGPSNFIPDDPFDFSTPHQSAQPLVPQPDAQSEIVDPLDLLGLDARKTPPNVRSASDLARSSVMSEHYQPPRPIAAGPGASGQGGGIIPSDYDPLASDDRPVAPPVRQPDVRVARPQPDAPRPRPQREAVQPPPPPVDRPAARAKSEPVGGAGGSIDLKAMLEGAGLSDVEVTPELARNFGQILRVVVGGVMDVLQARQKIKSEFRMGQTTFRAADNNPLKFSANVDDALHNLLVKRNAAYLGPVEAFEDAFGDMRNHQMAMLAGLRVAFGAMLKEFDPERLQAEFDRELKKGALVSVPAKFRYWELYRAKIHDMVSDTETCFRDLFGDEFARAYEEQLRRLKAQNRGPKR